MRLKEGLSTRKESKETTLSDSVGHGIAPIVVSISTPPLQIGTRPTRAFVHKTSTAIDTGFNSAFLLGIQSQFPRSNRGIPTTNRLSYSIWVNVKLYERVMLFIKVRLFSFQSTFLVCTSSFSFPEGEAFIPLAGITSFQTFRCIFHALRTQCP